MAFLVRLTARLGEQELWKEDVYWWSGYKAHSSVPLKDISTNPGYADYANEFSPAEALAYYKADVHEVVSHLQESADRLESNLREAPPGTRITILVYEWESGMD